MAGKITSFHDKLTALSIEYLKKRHAKKQKKKEQQAKKHPIVDWIEAFLWAAVMVLLLNQYLLQAYMIPTGSMVETLLVQDRIFVDKLIYGPEILPSLGKIDGPIDPQRNEILVFENPDPGIGTKSPVQTIFERLVYMLTLSMVNLDVDETGNPRETLLIKRAIGEEFEQIRYRDGQIEVRLPGGQWLEEGRFKTVTGIEYETRRIYDEKHYPALRGDILYKTLNPTGTLVSPIDLYRHGFNVPETIHSANLEFEPDSNSRVLTENFSNGGYNQVFDHLYKNFYKARLFLELYPQRTVPSQVFTEVVQEEYGVFVPENNYLLLGDNRDGSMDGRVWGPVKEEDVLGRALFIFWPLNRLGIID